MNREVEIEIEIREKSIQYAMQFLSMTNDAKSISSSSFLIEVAKIIKAYLEGE
ncbi:MAG TPA: hypothetical protein VMD05_05175 [Candidatus Nanoarchaeia archaeon]|nr:hypothetical protein [Candidatus Nanoarchaeia archaeon]